MTKTAAGGPVLAGDTLAYTITVSNAGPERRPDGGNDRRRAGQYDLRLRRPDFRTDVHSDQPRRGRHGHDHRHDRHAGPGRFGELYRGRPGVAEHSRRHHHQQHGGCGAATTFDPNLANNSQTVTTDVATQADLSLTKTTAAGPVVAGDTMAYTITVANAGPSDAQTVAMTDIVPANTTFISEAQTSGPTFTLTNPAVGGTGTITGTIATLALGASATFTVVVLVSPSTPDGTTITNTADVTAATFDPNLANNSQTVTTDVATQADLSVTKTAAAGPVVAGDTITYTITVANAGPSDAQIVALTDVLPANTTFVSDAQTSGPTFTLTNPALGGTGTITGTIGTLALGASSTFTVVVLVSPSTPAGTAISNTAEVIAATFDPNLANNSPTVTTDVATEADLSVTKTAAAGPVVAGDTTCLHDHCRERRSERRSDRGDGRRRAGQHDLRLRRPDFGADRSL